MLFKDIEIKDFKGSLQNRALIIDIRDKESYSKSNIPNAINYNSKDIMNLVEQKEKSIDIVIYCYHGNSSRKVAAFLSENGFKNVYSLIGGFSAWKEVR